MRLSLQKKSIRLLGFLFGFLLLQLLVINTTKAQNNDIAIGGGAGQLRITIQADGQFYIERESSPGNGNWVPQIYPLLRRPLFAINIGGTTYVSGDMAPNVSSFSSIGNDVISISGTRGEYSKTFSSSYNGNNFSVTIKTIYDTSNPDYFVLDAKIDTRNIPGGTQISYAYGYDAYVNNCDAGAAWILPNNLGYNGIDASRNLTQAQVQSLNFIGGINDTPPGSLMGFFPMGKAFDRAFSAHWTLSYADLIVNNTQNNLFKFGPAHIVNCQGGANVWDNGVGVAYDNILTGQITEISTGLTFTTSIDGTLDYLWDGVKNKTATVGATANLELIYNSISPMPLTGVGFQANFPGLNTSGTCTVSNFSNYTSSCTNGSNFYRIQDATIMAGATGRITVPITVVQYGQWVVNGSSISNTARTLPTGTPATLTASTTVNVSNISTNAVCRGESATVTVKLDSTATTSQPITIDIDYTGSTTTASDYTARPTSVTIPVNSNSATFTITTSATATDNAIFKFKLSGTDKVFATIGNNALGIITVKPKPTLSSTLTPATICSGDAFVYTATSAMANTTFSWTRATVAGINNAAGNGTSANINEVLTNTTSDPINVVYQITMSAPNACSYTQAVTVQVRGKLSAGMIGASQTICNLATPAGLTNVTSPSGGTGTYTYQWQSSTDNSNWNNISSGGTAATYSPGALTATTYFRRAVTSGSCGTDYTPEIKITVYDKFIPGIIGSDQTVCSGATPAGLTNLTSPTGGTGTYTYQWQSSTDNNTWTNISSATSATYNPGPLTTITYFRRAVTSGSCGTVYSPNIVIKVNNNLTPGTISGLAQTCPNTSPGQLAGTLPDGGSGPYSYQWQTSANGSTWTDIASATSQNYTPGALTSTTYFRRKASDPQCGSATSNELKIIIAPTVAYWKKSAANSNWNDPANWVDAAGSALSAIPSECTNVHVPGNADNYPSLDATNTLRSTSYKEPSCDSIVYHFGAEVAQPQLLNYKQALIQYNFGYYDTSFSFKTDGDIHSASPMNRGQWYALATPLKKIATGDFSVGGYPNIWQKWFHCSKATSGNFTGKWQTPASQAGTDICGDQRYAVSIWTGEYLPGIPGEGQDYHTNLNALKGVVEMPYFENLATSNKHRIHHYDGVKSSFDYYRYDVDGVPIVAGAGQSSITRGKEAYRFIFDNDITTIPSGPAKDKQAFKITVPAGEEVMIGNPFVSTLDFRRFYEANEADPFNPTKLESCYRLYMNNVWQEYSYTAGSGVLTQYIAPLQAFFVCTKGTGSVDLYFPFEVSVARKTQLQLRSSFPGNMVDDALYVEATNSKGNNSITLGLNREGEQNIYKLFYESAPEAPQIYFTDANKSRNAIQFEGNKEMEIPLGIQCAGEGQVELSFSNLKNLNTKLLILADRFTGREQDLLTNSVYKFTNMPGDFNKERFVLRIGKREIPTGFELPDQNSIKIYAVGKTLYVKSALEIEEVTIINAQGLQIISDSNINNSSYTKPLQIATGVYMVSVRDKNGNIKTEKIIIN